MASTSSSEVMAPEVAALDFATLPVLSEPSIMDFGRPEVEHQMYKRSTYKLIRPLLLTYWTLRYFGKHYSYPTALAILLYFLYVPIWIIIPVCLAVYYKLYLEVQQGLAFIAKRMIGHEFGKPIIKTLPDYKDTLSIWKLWAKSPTRVALLTAASKAGLISKEDAIKTIKLAADDAAIPVAAWDRPEEATVYQPVEGFCGPATLNSLLRSIPGTAMVPFARMPGPVVMQQYGPILLETGSPFSLAAANCVKSVTAYNVDSTTIDYEVFKEIIQKANNPKYRLMVNFLRAPLFFERPTNATDLAWKLMGGHWSNVCGVDNTTDQVLIADVNDSYGPFIVNSHRLFEACYTKDGSCYRGLILVELADDFESRQITV